MNFSTDEVVALEKPPVRHHAPAASRHDPTRRIRGRRRAFQSTVVALVAIVLGSGLWLLLRQLAPQISTLASPESAYAASFPEGSIAVLPFEDTNEPGKSSLLAQSVQDAILTALSKVAAFKVISSTSVASYAPGKPRFLRDISQNLGAGHVLEGKVSQSADRVRITTQLTDARTGVRLWNVTYEPEPGDVFGIRSDLVPRVAAQLHATISPIEKAAIDEPPTRDVVAYGQYIRGKTLVFGLANGQIREKLMQAVELLDQAVSRDPGFYLAYGQLAAAHGYLYFFGFDHTPGRLALAEKALGVLSQIHPEAGETHLAWANFHYRCHLDFEKARAELKKARNQLPNDSEAFELAGYIDRRQGRWAESQRSLQRAIKLDPQNVFLLQQIAASYQEARQFGAMAAALDRALAINPHDVDTRVTRAVVELEWKAETRPLHQLVDALLAEKADSAGDLADQWFNLSLCERNPAAIARSLAAIPATGISTDVNFPRVYCEALAARAQGDEAAAHKAFLAARVETETMVREQPDYGPVYTALGLVDAALGRKEEAMQEGRRAMELLPLSKDAIDGAEVMKYLAVIYAWCGEKDLALEQIAATLRVPSTLSYGNLKLHPYWDALRGDPRFEKIVADLAPES